MTVEGGQVVGREMRPKLAHHHAAGEAAHSASHDVPHGTDVAGHDHHATMADAITDCQAVLARGMGYGAYQSMQRLGIVPVITDLAEADAAALAYAAGELIDHPERLH